jgi:hypothetical protein
MADERLGRLAEKPGLLLICPDFFDYARQMSDAFSNLGFAVTRIGDRASTNMVYKMLLRLFPLSVSSLSRGYFTRATDRLEADGIGQIVIVKGEALSASTLSVLRRRFRGAKVALYLWDSADNSPNARFIAPLCDSVLTFDAKDSAELGWRYRPLFARRVRDVSVVKLYDWSFVGTLHSDRLNVLARLKQKLPNRRAFVFGYYPSRLLALAGFLSGAACSADRDFVLSTTPLEADKVEAICDASIALVDIEHPRQHGLTIRTIEALLSGRKLITTNAHICETPLYHPSRVLIISRNEPSVPDSFFDSDAAPVDDEIAAAYTIERWALDVLEGRTSLSEAAVLEGTPA